MIWASIIQVVFLLLLNLLFFAMVRNGLIVALGRSRTRHRLSYIRRSRWVNRMETWLTRYNGLYRHLSDMLEVIASKFTPGGLIFVTAVGTLLGFLIGAWYFRTYKGAFTAALILGGTPYLLCRMRWVNLRFQTRLEFLPAVEVFYQVYLLNGGFNIRNTLQLALADRRLLHPIGPVFEQLHRQLSTGRDAGDALRLFALALGHVWADYFANILRIGLMEGIDISDSLQELIADMRRAKRADQMERNRLLEIRIANYTPICFLALFLGVNAKINPGQAYYFYLIDPVGRNLLLDALLLIFASFLMGAYLSMKRM